MRLTLFLDHACNFRCSYCYNGDHFHREMPLDVAKRAVDLVVDGPRPLKQVGYFGGEPLLRFELLKASTDYVRLRTAQYPAPVTLVVTTNGSLLDDERLDWLGVNGFHVGVSIDGTRAAQDACRVYPGGRSTHDDVVAGIRRTLEKGLPLKTVSVVDPANAAELPATFRFLVELGVRDMSFNINYEADWDEAARDAFRLQFHEFTDAYVDLFRRGTILRVNVLDAKVITHLKGGFACSDRCDFGCEELAVAPSGNLYPCDRLIGEDARPDVIIGTVFEGVDTAARDRLIAAKNAVLSECADCGLVNRCMHWCGCVNYAMTGSVGEVSGLLCWFEQLFIEEADRAAGILFAEKNPGFIKRFYSFAL
ncbi:MAG: radical SAM protein [Deltaproteobacteria bacterium]|nr:radical SAM protein [Deltaproteobacteria bacterium]